VTIKRRLTLLDPVLNVVCPLHVLHVFLLDSSNQTLAKMPAIIGKPAPAFKGQVICSCDCLAWSGASRLLVHADQMQC
jgi:hypothetical protein